MPQDAPRSRAVDLGFGAVHAAALTVWAATALALLRPTGWPLELASHLHVVYLVALLPVVAAAALRRRFRWALAHAGVAALNVGVVAPLWLAAGANEARGTPLLRAALLNVHAPNRDFAPVLALLRRERPDVAVVLEVTPEWHAQLATLRDLLPHQHVEPRPDCFGIAVLARRPLEGIELRRFAPDAQPSFVARWRAGEGTVVQLVATHPVPPMRAHMQRRRNRQLRGLADWLRAQSGPVVVLGDLNTGPWAPAFAQVLDGTRLRDGRRGHGVLPTWPAHLGVAVVPIDHVLVTPEIAVTELRVGPSFGSDHLPLWAALQLRTAGTGGAGR